MKQKIIFPFLLGIILLFSGCSEENISTENNKEENTNTPSSEGFSQEAEPKSGDTIAIVQTNMGTIKIRLFPEQAPKTVENFVGLAKEGKYEDVIFHRVIKNFMIQGGDPTGTGMGGNSFFGEDFENEPHKDLKNIRGSIAMANRGVINEKGTNSSQFFINQVDNTNLDGYLANGEAKDCSIPKTSCHTVFGQVYEGIQIVDQIAKVETDRRNRPLEDVIIEKVTIEKL